MIDRLIEAIRKKKTPVVVGLDPLLRFVPSDIQQVIFRECGETLEAACEAIWYFNREIIDHIHDLVPAIKPQIAMYEQFGAEGIKMFRRTAAYGREKNLIVIGDIKRGDIGSTAEAYAAAHLGRVEVGRNRFAPFCEDFVTVNPYLGFDGVKPFIDVAKEENKGLFLLVKTSNPSSGEFQDRLVDGRPLYEHVAEKVAEWGELHMGKNGYSYVGAVTGATYPEQGKRLRQLMPKSFLLVPGYGAQGGKAADLAPFFNADGLGALVNSSRGIIAAWQDEKYARFGSEGFAEAARAAVEDMIEDLRKNI
jgi:orotidine-5'-phosphate decarboxylase